jgi:hypothetical protein
MDAKTICFLSDLSTSTIILILAALSNEKYWGQLPLHVPGVESTVDGYIHWLTEELKIRTLAPTLEEVSHE